MQQICFQIDKKEKLLKELEEKFKRWDDINSNGTTCPNYTDGYYMGTARHAIIRIKNELSEQFSDITEEIYLRPVPPEVDKDYMANVEWIKERALKSLQLYLKNTDYKYILQFKNNKEINRKVSSLVYVLGYVSNLEHSINTDDYLYMRLHKNPTGYMDSFKRARQEIEKQINKKHGVQLTLNLVM